MWAIVQVLKDAVTPEIAKAWSEAYDFLAYVLIERERELREAKAKSVGGWEGYREFEIIERVQETSDVVSLHLKPKDHLPLFDNYEPGSYVAVQLDTANGRTVRNYTLSSPPGHNVYRISVKMAPPAVAGAPVGIVSSLIHRKQVGDVIRVGVPCGELHLKDAIPKKPIVFINGGIGITPTVSMLESIIDRNITDVEVILLYACRTGKSAALINELKAYAKGKSNIHIYSFPDPPAGAMNDKDGFIDYRSLMDRFAGYIPNKDANYFFCGPPHFMEKVKAGLEDWSVPSNQVHYEFFGPASNIEHL